MALVMFLTICITSFGQVNEGSQNVSGNQMMMVPDVQKMQETMAKLKDLEPLTSDQLKSWFPESVDGLVRQNLEVVEGSMPNVVSISATYITPDEPEYFLGANGEESRNPNYKSLIIGVTDGAGPTGSAWIMTMVMMTDMNFEMDDDQKQQQVIEVENVQAQQTFNKKTIRTELQFVFGERFGIGITGRKMNPDETKAHVESLDFETLPGLGN